MKMSCAISIGRLPEAQAVPMRSPAVEAERGSRRLMSLQKAVDILGQFRTNAFGGRDLLHGRFAEPIDGTESTQKQILAVLTHSRAIVENTFTDALLH